MHPQNPQQPETLWHYTTWVGLEGIVNSNVLWATDARHLNDLQELAIAVPLLQDAWDEAYELLHAGGGAHFSALEFGRLMTIFQNGGQPVTVKDDGGPAPYVTSFCGQADLLSQWRGYSGGRGYALGFRFEELECVAACADRSGLFPVVYPTGQPPEGSDQPYDVPEPNTKPDQNGDLWLDPIARGQIKHPAFSEEDEWRILCAAGTSLVHKTRGEVISGLAPYVEVPLEGVRPCEVMIGPGGSLDEDHRLALRLFLRTHGWADVPVTISATPLR